MIVRMYDLSTAGKTTCQTRRNVTYDLNAGEKDYIVKSKICKENLMEFLFNGLTKTDLQEKMKVEFKDIPYRLDKQRRINAAEGYRMVISAEKLVGAGYPAKAEDIFLSSSLKVAKVKPDMIRYGTDEDGPYVEIIRFKFKKPDIGSRAAGRNLELYTLIKYGRKLVAPGTKIIASFYFLKRKEDNRKDEEYDDTMPDFLNEGGKNVVSMVQYPNDGYEEDLDELMKPSINAFVTGVPEQECSAEDCKVCDYSPICKFTDPPLQLPVKKSARVASAIRLTPDQREAKEYEKGICRINAGAGAGKTLTVTLRVVSLLNKGVLPKEILMITFTNAGAQEMRERIAVLADDDGIADEVDLSEMMIMTFNAFGDMIIREEYKRLGYEEPPHLIDDVERLKIVSEMLKETEIEGLDYKNFATDEFHIHGAVATAAKAFEVFKKNPTLGIADIDRLKEKMDGYSITDEVFLKLYRLYSDYDEKLRDNGLIEFADQENLIFELLGMDPYYFEKFGIKHIIVDEFQDSSQEQIDIIKRMTNCPSFESLMVVGDDSQSIYSFRDTTPEFLINFDKVMGCAVDDIQLVENHRSTPEIIEFANRINRMNKFRIDKDLVATRPHGEPVIVKGFLTADEERSYVVSEVKSRIIRGTKPEDIAILARNKTELNKMADLLAKEGIASIIQFPEKLSEDSRVQGALAMLKAIKDGSDTKDLLIYANTLVGGKLKGASMSEVGDAIETAKLRIADYKAVTDETEKKEKLNEMLKELDPDELDTLYKSFVDGLLLRSSEKMFSYSEDFSVFGKNVAVRREGNYPGVVLSTAHSSKGLEWPICFNMIGGYDKPELHSRTYRCNQRVEEERRLLFVSATRARDVLYITAQYTCGGKLGDYLYNQFLADSYHALDMVFSTEEIEAERKRRKDEEKARKKAEKDEAAAAEKAKAETDKKSVFVGKRNKTDLVKRTSGKFNPVKAGPGWKPFSMRTV